MAVEVTCVQDSERVLTCTSDESPAPAPSRDAAFLFSSCTRSQNTAKRQTHIAAKVNENIWRRVEQQQRFSYPLQQVSGLLREVGRQTQFTLQDLVDGLFPVLSGERRLQRER